MKQNQQVTQARGSLKPPSQVKSKLSPPTQIGASSPIKTSSKDLTPLNPPSQFKSQGSSQQISLLTTPQIPDIPHQQSTPQAQSQGFPQMKSRANTMLPPAAQMSKSAQSFNTPYQNVQLYLHKVLGMSSFNNENFAIIGPTIVAYLAANVIVIFDIYENKQIMLFHNQNNKAYRVLKFFPDQSWLVAGEGNTKQGEIQIFSIINNQAEFLMMHFMTLKGHKYGVRNFDLQESLLVSIGDDNDKGVLVWDLKQHKLLSANLSKKSLILSLAFLVPQGETKEIVYVTCGTEGHLKKWIVKKVSNDEGDGYQIIAADNQEGQKIPKQKCQKIQLSGSNQNEIEYQRVVDSKDGLFVLAYKHHSHKIIKLEKKGFTWVNEVNLEHSNLEYNFSKYSDSLLIVGCQNGQTKLIDTHSCKFSSEVDLSWAKPPFKDQFQKISKEMYDYLKKGTQQKQGKYANIIAVKCEHDLLIQIFDDGLLLIHSISQSSLLRVLYSHNDLINDLAIKDYVQWDENITFMTGSKDNTLRIWSVSLKDQKKSGLKQQYNPVDGDLKRVLFLDEGTKQELKPGQPEEERGIKSLAYNQMRNQLAIGDMKGNIRIFQLSQENNQTIHEIQFIEAHEGKVVALCYSDPFGVPNTDDYVQYLVSASSDRMIHIFNALNDDYELLQTIDASTSSIVDVKISKCTIPVKSKNKVVSSEKQLRVYACATDKSILSQKFSPSDQKFLPLPKDINKNKINAIAMTDQTIILAKDQGLIEVKQLDSMKTVQTSQNTQSQHKNMLEYLRMDLSYDEQLIAVCDKEKSIQIREVRSVEKQLSKLFITDNLSSLKFSTDNKYILCSSLNPKETGGGIIYILKVEHAQDQIKFHNKVLNMVRNADDVITIDANDLEKQFFNTLRNSQLDENPILAKPPSQKMQEQSELPREFKVNDELFNTWAKSTNVKEQEEMKESMPVNKEDKKLKQQISQEEQPLRRQSSPLGPQKQDKLVKQQQAINQVVDDDIDDEKLDDIIDLNKKEEEDNLLGDDIDLVIDDIAPKDVHNTQEELKKDNSQSQLRRNSITQKYRHNPNAKDQIDEKKHQTPKATQQKEEIKLKLIPKSEIGTDNIANESKNGQILKEYNDLSVIVKDKVMKLKKQSNLSEIEKKKLLISVSEMMRQLFEAQEFIIK